MSSKIGDISYCLRHLGLICFLWVVAGQQGTRAQQSFQSSWDHLDPYRVNPASAGLEDGLILSASYRSQWQGLEGHPEFLALHAHLPLYAFGGATGMMLRKEDIGVESDISATFSYNQVWGFDFGLVSLGARAGFKRKKLYGDKLFAAGGDYTDGAVQHNDDFLPDSPVSGLAPVWGIGLYFFSGNVNFGMIFDDSPVIAMDLKETTIEKRQLFTVHGEYFLNLSTPVRLRTFGLLRSDLVQWQLEAGLTGEYEDRFFASLLLRGYSGRSFDAVAVGFGGRLNKNLQIAYSYDITISPLRHVSNGAHELVLRYLTGFGLGKKIPQKILHSPRLYD
jgi:type IX secretion system PorP/SprF family membrane protein